METPRDGGEFRGWILGGRDSILQPHSPSNPGSLCRRNGTSSSWCLGSPWEQREEIKSSCFPFPWDSDEDSPTPAQSSKGTSHTCRSTSLCSQALPRLLTSPEQLLRLYQYLIFKLCFYFSSIFWPYLILRPSQQGEDLTLLSICNLSPHTVSTWQTPSHLSRSSSNVTCSVSLLFYVFPTMWLQGKIHQLHFTNKTNKQSLSLLFFLRPRCLYLILASTSLYYKDLFLFLCLHVDQESRNYDFSCFQSLGIINVCK